MARNILEKLNMQSRQQAVTFLKSLWQEKPAPCPLCGGRLDFLHKKAKKSNCDWVCTNCGERYDTIKILRQLDDR